MPIVNDGRARSAVKPASSPGGFTSGQKTFFLAAAVLCGPAVLKKVYEKPASEKVDLSQFNIVTHYDTPAIERMDDTLRIEFCAS